MSIYLDNGSTSFPKAPGVGAAMKELLENGACNVGRGGYRMAYDLEGAVIDCREKLCRFFNFDKPENVVFTQNITQSLNMMVNGLFKPGDHVVISSMEHNAVARPMEAAKKRGVRVTNAPCREDGSLILSAFEECLEEGTKAVLMIHGSNVSGTLMPAEEVGKICLAYGVPFILDAAQTAGNYPIDFKTMNLSALAFTGHKGLLGPQGIGGFLISDALAAQLDCSLFGGTGSVSDSLEMPEFLPDKYEVGTMNLPGIVGLSKALDYVMDRGVDAIRSHEMELTGAFLDALSVRPDVHIAGKRCTEGRGSVVSLDFPGRDNGEVAFRLDARYGIMTRVGLHCAPLAHKTLGTFPQGTVRFTFGPFNTMADVDAALLAIEEILEE